MGIVSQLEQLQQVASPPICSPAPLRKAEIAAAADVRSLNSELAHPAEYLLATTGKQLRSEIVLRSATLGQHPGKALIRTGAIAIELFQLVTLIHDDVVDDGQIRRGAEAVSVTHGSCASGFVGGALFARAAELIATCGDEPTRRFAQAANAVCIGQMAEFQDLFDTTRSPDRYTAAISGKTASLFELAAWLGAWLADAPPAISDALGRFGYQFGMAFQIADDILDLLAPEAATGKQQGKDLLQGVYTLPVLYGLETDKDLPKVLSGEITGDNVLSLVTQIKRSGGIQRADDQCTSWALRAKATLESTVEPAVLTTSKLPDLVNRLLSQVASSRRLGMPSAP